MPSQEMLEFRARCPAMPKRMPVDDLPRVRQERIDKYVRELPILEGVTTEKVTHDGVDAIWYRPVNSDPARMIIYFHGGGFMWSSADSHRGIISRVAEQAQCDTLALDYKVAPFSPFPGAINEGVSLYKSMLAAGYDPKRVAFVGDSAGGGLVLSVILALKREDITLPACATITSAYLDLTNSGESIDWVEMDPCVSREGLDICVEHYLQGHNPADPLASPIFAELEGFPPTLVQAGSREQLLSDSLRYAAKAETAGVDIKLEVYDGCVHLWHWWAPDAPESIAATHSIGEFVLAHTR